MKTSNPVWTTRIGPPWRRLTVFGMTLALLTLLVLWALSGSVLTAGCRTCHEMRSSGGSPAHAAADCYRCHAEPSVDGYLTRKALEVRMLVRSLCGTDPALAAAEPTRMSCLSCHDDVLMRTVEVRGLRIDHGTCAASSACSGCHDPLHGGEVARPGGGITMDRCFECHDDIIASWDCETCHTGEARADRPAAGSWAITHGPRWEITHGMGDLKTCGACHEKTKCEGCHGVPLPHPAGYVNGKHGQEAARNVSLCTACHASGFCQSCHGIEMPHPAGFLPQHSQIVSSSGSEACELCHVLEDCELCHVGHVHPGHR